MSGGLTLGGDGSTDTEDATLIADTATASGYGKREYYVFSAIGTIIRTHTSMYLMGCNACCRGLEGVKSHEKEEQPTPSTDSVTQPPATDENGTLTAVTTTGGGTYAFLFLLTRPSVAPSAARGCHRPGGCRCSGSA